MAVDSLKPLPIPCVASSILVRNIANNQWQSLRNCASGGRVVENWDVDPALRT